MLYIDGQVTTRVNFSVKTLGTNFLRGVAGHAPVTLSDGKKVNVQWEETTQGFTITGCDRGAAGPPEADERAMFEAILGTWQITMHFQGDASRPYLYTFATVERVRGYWAVTGRYRWSETSTPYSLLVSLTEREFPQAAPRLKAYPYVSYYEDGAYCWLEFFRLTSPTTLEDLSFNASLREGCEEYGDPVDMRGVRTQGP